MSVLAAVPVKRFFVAKRRLTPILDASSRSRLGVALANRTLETIASAGAEPVVVAADADVVTWARSGGWSTIADQGQGLNAAASTAVHAAAGRPWMVVHADLPLLAASDIAPALDALEAGRPVIAPSTDGGTSLLGGVGPFDFAYGPGSFHIHLARLTDPLILTRLGLMLDVDHPDDLVAAAAHARGAWLGEYSDLP